MKFLEPERKPKVIHLHWQFLGIRQSLWRSLLESLHVYTTPIRNKWYCWKSSAQSKGRHLCCIVAIGSKWNLVGRFHEMLHLSAKRHRSIVWWEDALWKIGQPFQVPIIPFGSWVEYYPITAKDQSRIHQFGKKVLRGLFLWYALYAVGIWKGDVLVADLEELETMDASEIYSKRLNAKEVIFPKENGEFIFPVAEEWKKVHLQYCCNQVWVTKVGRILWNVTAICETFKICFCWEDTLWEAVRNTTQRTNYPIWSNGRISPYFFEKPV